MTKDTFKESTRVHYKNSEGAIDQEIPTHLVPVTLKDDVGQSYRSLASDRENAAL